MSDQIKSSEVLTKKVASNPPVVLDEDLKNDPIIVVDEEERRILKKIDLQ